MATEINAGRVAMVPKGEWSASTAYVRLDVVSYHGSSYVCKQDGTGQTPDTATNYWQLLSSGLDPTVDTISAKHYEGSTVTAETNISAAGVISKTASGVTKTYNLPAESGTLSRKEETLPNKTYAPLEFSGLGRKYLQKNIVSDKNVLTQAMVNDANTIYVIQYDYDLNGQSITLPSGCTLQFDGGSLANGTLVGTNTTIEAGDVRIFSNVSMSGTFVNDSAPLSWWCVKYDSSNEVDNSSDLGKAIGCPIKRIVIDGLYGISKPVNSGSKYLLGNNNGNFKNCGFVANSDFDSIEVTLSRDGNTYEVSGMLYHSFDQAPSLTDISLQCKFHADYAIQHLAGYSWPTLDNVYIDEASVCGILQYGSEMPMWRHVWVRNCNIGIYVSTNTFNPSNPLDFTGTKKGSANLMRMTNVRVNRCNYGIICHGLWNMALDNCEIAYNNILGLVISGCQGAINSLYSEGDSLCQKYIKSDGTILEGSTENNRMKTCQYLIDNNLDGYYINSVYVRTPILCRAQSRVTFKNPFISVNPRSYYNNPTDEQVLGFDTMAASGVDCCILLSEDSNHGIYDIQGAYTYILSNNNSASPKRFLLLSSSIIYSDFPQVSISGCNYSKVESISFADYGYADCKRAHAISVDGQTSTYNAALGMAGTTFWGYTYDKKYIKQRPYVISYKGFPIYDMSAWSGLNYWIPKATFEQVFAGETQLVAKCVVQVKENFTGIIRLFVGEFVQDSTVKQSAIQTSRNSNSYTAGFIEITQVFNVYTGNDYNYVKFRAQLPSQCNASPFFLYKLGDALTSPEDINYAYAIGTTAQRPSTANDGAQYYDTDLNKLLLWNGTAWVQQQDALTFDSAPTSSSSNPVTSGGIYTALTDKLDKSALTSAIPASGLLPNVAYNFGITDSPTVTLNTDGVDPSVANEWYFTFVAKSSSCSVTLPSNVKLANGYSWSMAAGRTFYVSIKQVPSSYNNDSYANAFFLASVDYVDTTLDNNYLTIESLGTGNVTIDIPAEIDSTYMTSLSYSTDKTNWTDLTVDNTAQSITVPVVNGDKVYLKGSGSRTSNGTQYINITSSANHNVSGNIMSLLLGDNFAGQTSFPQSVAYIFRSLFQGSTTLVRANDLVLPVATMKGNCYQRMFYGCTSLIAAPKLPATAMSGECYSSMFSGCTSLVTAPALPSTSLGVSCYTSMFYGCTSLQSAPSLQATTLKKSCYSSMFNNCTSLTTAPELSATTLEEACYAYMFVGCANLNRIKMLATDISATNCLTQWVYQVSSTGTFVKAASMVSLPSGINGIPSGWTVEDES